VSSRLLDRRTFLATGAVGAAGATAWITTSASWGARFVRERAREFGRDVPSPSNRPTPDSWSDSSITLTWLGHATVLVNFYGFWILTDPVLFPRIGVDLVVGSLGPLRLVDCAIPADELPELDLVLVSHAHFDHLDTPSLAMVLGRPAAVMAVGTSDLLPWRAYSSITELRWDQTTRVRGRHGDALVRAIEVKHWGARLRRDTWRGYTGFVVEREGRRLLIAGDTAATPLFRSHRRYGPYDAAVMPIGAYNPWIRNHCTPEQAVAMADAASARLFVPVHHQTFRLSNEPYNEPIERAAAALQAEHDRLAVSEVGETVVIRA
jgi:L-ascorbate metabolism protein UlaG (beta-lactamase superfamily)